ncbi:MAG: hypothetical protein WAM60_01080 [Candidatus Promineifilaceae bacterium]
MERISQLQNLDPAAWTLLLEQDQDCQGTTVTAVYCEKSANNLTRYQLTLAGYNEPILLIGKKTNESEIRFYQTIAPYLSVMVPKCWFSHLNGENSWVVLSEVYNDWPPGYWTAGDVEAIIDDICDLHATFWDQEEHLSDFDCPHLLPKRRRKTGRPIANNLDHASIFKMNRPDYLPFPNEDGRSLLSSHAVQTAGQLTPLLEKAAIGLEKLQMLGGWPNIFDDQHILAAADLLDDPVPMLQPLQLLPTTLLHGKLSPSNWRLNLFDDHHLINWEHLNVGPGIFDLVHFIEEFDLLSDENGWRSRSCWPVLEETMIDSYLLNMGGKIGSSFNATAARQAVPAARCLYVLTTWLPRFATWFQIVPDNLQDWQKFNQMCDEQLVEAGFELMAGIRPYLTNLFQRFLTAYRML